IEARMNYNGGIKFGYIDNQYPCGIFPEKNLREISFGRITIFYGGNGSGKSTLLNFFKRHSGLFEEQLL
ncbi:MAG: AAA family ATPase, partial [Firmicutes bacterium]|nr:AAA family ATPase [Bacillota bacterium]